MKSLCPLKSFYCYEGKCPVNTCQHNTPVTERGCLIQDRQERHDRISDAEILYYKIKPNKEQFASKSLDAKFASYIRKRSVLQAKGNMTLYLYIMFCKHSMKPHPSFNYKEGSNSIIDEAVNSSPLNIPELNFEIWMIYYLYNVKFLNHFVESQERKTNDINIINVLGTTPRRFDLVVNELKKF